VTPVVIDTDVASFIFNRNLAARSYEQALRGAEPVLSFMTVAEMRAGALMANWGSRRKKLQQDFLSDFRVIYANDRLCSLWAELRAGASRRGRHVSAQDAWVAATALALDAPLATNNRSDYEHIPGLELLAL
jgi:tRNA(fMet)-specific endonuclease VapC